MDLLSNLFTNRISKKMSHHFVGAFDPALSREHGPAKHPADNRLRAGLSLVEVMIALGLLATVMSALLLLPIRQLICVSEQQRPANASSNKFKLPIVCIRFIKPIRRGRLMCRVSLRQVARPVF